MDNSTDILANKDIFFRFKYLQNIALFVLVCVTGALFIWGSYVPLKSAVFASGYLRAEDYSKQVQYFDGGIVDAVWVREGDYVIAGTLLVSMDDEDIKTRLNAVIAEYMHQRAISERLNAFLKGFFQIDFSPGLLALADQIDQHHFLDEQTLLLLGQQAQRHEQTQLFEARVAQLTTRINTQTESYADKQMVLNLLRRELQAAKSLGIKKFIAQQAVNRLERQLIELRNQQRVLAGKLDENNKRIAELEVMRKHQETLVRLDALKQSQQIEQELPQQKKAMALLQRQLKRSQVVAQVSGKVSNLKVHNKGVTVPAGAHLMDIVPDQEQLVVEARLRPQDIDEISAGLNAKVRLTAYNQRRSAPLAGRIIQVSPDRLIDGVGEPFYAVMIQLDRQDLKNPNALILYPGMPAEAVIVTGERTLSDYLLAPLLNLKEKGMREI